MDPITWVYIIVLVVSLVVAVAMAPKPKSAKPPALSDFSVPTVEDGREIVDFGGTVWIDDPNITWYGDLKVYPPIKATGGK
ncbi:hypothetical protein [Rhodanobacter denitrificans]|uniref:Uncharacterized protein n=1 Tax=Rhodanobacter denitrificans TaxID=666685 RepID=M4NJT0_9GAMM|nr:hypothetical protein [Rhodanobacter denitrificans]AGG89938.1 hypothetical protein R2APBS1_2861 [Rhodanobacter denitrificans]UJM85333.1 hypothetical protein LRJ86_11135 [Rhodanobacter denitrificans]